MGLEAIFKLIGDYQDRKQRKSTTDQEFELRNLEAELARGRLMMANEQLGMERQAQQRLLGMDDAAKSWANRQAFFGNGVQPQTNMPFPQPQGLEAMLPSAQKAMEANMLFGAAPMQQNQELQLLGNRGNWFAQASPDIQRGLAADNKFNAAGVATANQGIEDRAAGVYAANAQQEVAKSLLGTTLAQQGNERLVNNKQLADAAFKQELIAKFADDLMGIKGNVMTNPRLGDGTINFGATPLPTAESIMMQELLGGNTQYKTLENGVQVPLDPNSQSHRFAPPTNPQPKPPTTKVAIDSPVAAPKEPEVGGLLGMGGAIKDFVASGIGEGVGEGIAQYGGELLGKIVAGDAGVKAQQPASKPITEIELISKKIDNNKPLSAKEWQTLSQYVESKYKGKKLEQWRAFIQQHSNQQQASQ